MVRLGCHTTGLLLFLPVTPRSVLLRFSSHRRIKGTPQGHGHQVVELRRRRDVQSVCTQRHSFRWEGRERSVGRVLDYTIPVLGHAGEGPGVVERAEE